MIYISKKNWRRYKTKDIDILGIVMCIILVIVALFIITLIILFIKSINGSFEGTNFNNETGNYISVYEYYGGIIGEKSDGTIELLKSYKKIN